jgi:hypothetical protein
MALEQTADAILLKALALAVDNPYGINLCFPAGIQVLFQEAGYLFGGKGVQIQNVLDRHYYRFCIIRVARTILHGLKGYSFWPKTQAYHSSQVGDGYEN